MRDRTADSAISGALRAIRQRTSRHAAPHVVAELVRTTGGAAGLVVRIAEMLSAPQLRGDAVLPDPLPLPPDGVDPIRIAPAYGRLLLFAALSETRDPLEIVEAAGLEIDVLLRGEARTHLELHGGTVGFADPLARSRILHFAETSEIRHVHAALSRMAARRGALTAAAWHTVHAQTAPPASAAIRLVAGAERALSRGDADAAYRYATAAAPHLDTMHRQRASALAGLAAFWSGRPSEALATFAEAGGVFGSLEEQVDAVIGAAQALRGSRGAEIRPGEERAMRLLQAASASAEDRRVLGLLADVCEGRGAEPQRLDRLQAEIVLLGARAVPRSPLVDAQLQVFLTCLHLGRGDASAAARTLTDAIPRLPLGVGAPIGDLIRAVASHGGSIDVRIAEAFDALAPHHRGAPLLSTIPTPGPLAAEALAHVRAVRGPVALPVSAGLSRRQQDVVRLLASGKSNKEIGQQLGLSERTVEVHLGHAYRKVGVGSRVELIARMLAVGK